MSTSTSSLSPTRENILYAIPSSTITLDILLNNLKPLSSSSVYDCLSGALDEARKQTQSSLVEGVFRYYTSPPVHAEFHIVGGIFVNDLTWSDVVTVLQGLQKFYVEKGSYASVLVYLEDEQTETLGNASVVPGEERAVDGMGQGGGEGGEDVEQV